MVITSPAFARKPVRFYHPRAFSILFAKLFQSLVVLPKAFRNGDPTQQPTPPVMNKKLRISLVIACLIGGLQASEVKMLADFTTEATSLNWRTVNDGVMGGRSKGVSFVTEASHLLFKGQISLENNGGFSSIRTFGETQDLSSYDGIELKIKGDGRKYYLTSRCSGSSRLAFWSPIQPTKNEWFTMRIPFKSFYATSLGRKTAGVELDLENITSLGFMLYDKKEGKFQLEIESINAYELPKQSKL